MIEYTVQHFGKMTYLAVILLFADVILSKHFLIETEGRNCILFFKKISIFLKDSLIRRYGDFYEDLSVENDVDYKDDLVEHGDDYEDSGVENGNTNYYFVCYFH